MRHLGVISTLLAILFLGNSAAGEFLKVRIGGGIPYSTGDFSESSTRIRHDETTDFVFKFKTDGERNFSFGVSHDLVANRLAVGISTGLYRFDDIGQEITETTYEFPLGVGTTNFKHQIIPLRLRLEYSRSLKDRWISTIGAGVGAYFHKMINTGHYQRFISGYYSWYGRSRRPFEYATFLGYSFVLGETAKISPLFGIYLNFTYDYIPVNKDEQVGMMPASAMRVHTISNLALEAGLAISL